MTAARLYEHKQAPYECNGCSEVDGRDDLIRCKEKIKRTAGKGRVTTFAISSVAEMTAALRRYPRIACSGEMRKSLPCRA